jgi:hypothetical protein
MLITDNMQPPQPPTTPQTPLPGQSSSSSLEDGEIDSGTPGTMVVAKQTPNSYEVQLVELRENITGLKKARAAEDAKRATQRHIQDMIISKIRSEEDEINQRMESMLMVRANRNIRFPSPAHEGRRVQIQNLPMAATKADLVNFFNGYLVEFGSVSLPKKSKTNIPAGYGYIDLLSSREADRAIRELSGRYIFDQQVHVRLAAPAPSSLNSAAASKSVSALNLLPGCC